MKVHGLDGRVHNWNLSGHVPLNSDPRPRSADHVRARKLLGQLFPADRALEELSLPGSKGLYADFFLANRKAVIEVHGRQHYEFVPHFHKTRLGFLQHKGRDQMKRDWCELNSFAYIELPYHESDDEWTKRIFGDLRTETGEGR